MNVATLQAQLARPASKIVVGGFRPPTDPFTSWFGRVLVGLPGEEWPTNKGKLMLPLCQLNLTEAPYVPESLADFKLLSVFIGPDELPIDTPNGDGWLLRSYQTLDELYPLVQSSQESFVKPFPIRWEFIEKDYPDWDDVANMFPEMEFEELQEFLDGVENHHVSKIGGWPSLIQSEIFWAPGNRHPANPEYVFQIDTEAKSNWSWGDAGTGYFGIGTGNDRDQWTLDWQCY